MQSTSEQGKVARNILSLPNEILIKILTFVQTKDLLLNVSRVSKKFHEAAENPHAHVYVKFSDTINWEDLDLINFLTKNNLIEELHFSKGQGSIRQFDDDILDAIEGQRRLKNFSIDVRHLIHIDQLFRWQNLIAWYLFRKS
jgi:hypothetical protein